MVRADFDRSLEELEAELLGLGEMVEKAIVKSMDALICGLLICIMQTLMVQSYMAQISQKLIS